MCVLLRECHSLLHSSSHSQALAAAFGLSDPFRWTSNGKICLLIRSPTICDLLHLIPMALPLRTAPLSCSFHLGDIHPSGEHLGSRSASAYPLSFRSVPTCSYQLAQCGMTVGMTPWQFRLRLRHALSSVVDHSTDSSSGLRELQWRLQERTVAHRSKSVSVAVVRAVIVLQWIEKICSFIKGTPAKLFARKFEADVHKVATIVEEGAKAVQEVSKDINEIAEAVESAAERAETIAEKVEKTTKLVEKRVDEALEVIDGEKDLVITGYTVVDKEEDATASGTAKQAIESEKTVTAEKTHDSSG
eukprot:c47292_g1_i1 orf=313-1221(-)